ncbi:MAG: type 4a pilus biogenesis protein PilO [Fimbriimonas sp.]
MINFKDKNAVGFSSLIVLAILVLATTLAVMLFLPKPTDKGIAKQRRDKELELKLSKQQASDRLAELKASINSRIWDLPADQIGPGALSKVSQAAAAHKLKIVAFRPQRANEAEDLIQLPYLVTLDGPYLSVLGFVQDIQAKENKLAVNLVQLASADGASNRVTASVSLMAYQKPPLAKPTEAPTKRTATGTASTGGSPNNG